MANRQNPFFTQEISLRLTNNFKMTLEEATHSINFYIDNGYLSRSKVKPFTYEIIAWAIYKNYTLDNPKVLAFIN